MPKNELPCMECEHADFSCGELACELEGRALHLMSECPIGEEI